MVLINPSGKAHYPFPLQRCWKDIWIEIARVKKARIKGVY